jgi:plastocyanin
MTDRADVDRTDRADVDRTDRSEVDRTDRADVDRTDRSEADRTDPVVREGGASSGSGRRRVLLAAGASLSAALAAGGCLSNPWGPSSPGGDDPAGGAEDDPGTDAATASGGEPTAETTRANGDGGTTANGDGGTTANGDGGTTANGDGGTTRADDAATPTDATETATAVPPEERDPDQVVEVAPDGFVFSPETFTIEAGDTVHWQWKDSGHNVRVREQPEDSEWTGTPGGASDTYGEGYLHAHTFEVAGEYECFCAPHQTLGLEGSFTVR